MKQSRLFLVAWVGVAALATIAAVRVSDRRLPNVPRADQSILLPNGWSLTPAGRHLPLPGDLPLKMSFGPDGKTLYVVTGGFHDQGVTAIDISSEKVSQTLNVGNAWAGLAVDSDKLFVSGGASKIRQINLAGGMTRAEDIGTASKKKKKKAGFMAGMVKVGDKLYVVSNGGDAVIRFGGTEWEAEEDVAVGYRPYSIVASPDGKTLAVSNWGDQSISFIDVASFKETSRTKVGIHPNELIYAKDGRLFVANAGSNTVSVLRNGVVTETIRTSVSPNDKVGSTPDALALSPDDKTLYVANADNNAVAVVDVSHAESNVKGFIPTGWYPSALALSPDGKRLFVGVGKGLTFRANPAGATTKYSRENYDHRFKYDYIGALLSGYVSVVDVPSDSQLKAYSHQVALNMPTADRAGISAREVDRVTKNVLRKIKHVVYVIRENRTYDQVLGDMPKGNGDKNLVIFGKEVTPNAHALASEFVLLDNLYCNGEVSEDGHQWSNAAYATHFTERAWTNSYSGRGEPDADDRLTASPGGYLWDSCRKKGLDYISYGEFSSFKSTPDTEPVFTGNKGLEGHASAEWAERGGRSADQGRDYRKIDVFIDDLEKAQKTGKWHDYMVMSLGEDHTSGLNARAFTPQACVASNDLAIGKMIEAISHSKFWAETAVFIIEDDAQNGPDHVDAHRTVGLVISPYVKRNALDSTMYSTSSMLRTMELILGLEPMTQYDERATPMVRLFQEKPDLRPYTTIPAQIDLNARNPEKGSLVEASGKLDWSAYDRADPDKLNEILWKALKPGSPMPAPVRSSRFATMGGEED